METGVNDYRFLAVDSRLLVPTVYAATVCRLYVSDSDRLSSIVKLIFHTTALNLIDADEIRR
jgi:hypothetical protein